MSEDNKQGSNTLEDRIKRLETLQRNTRIAIIILVGYSIYDVISVDTGSEIIFSHKVKARAFELIDGQGTVFGSWKLIDEKKRTAGLVIESAEGKQMTMTADQVKLTNGRINPVATMTLDEKGVTLFDSTHSESVGQNSTELGTSNSE